MTTTEIGQSLVAFCNRGDFDGAYHALFADDARSIEPDGHTTTGMPALLEKAQEWGEQNTVNSVAVRGPYVSGDTFAVHYLMNLTPKATGEAMAFEEVGMYSVAGGKIIQEAFLYGV